MPASDLKNAFNVKPPLETVNLFCKAAEAGDCAKVSELLKQYGKAIVNEKDGFGWTPLQRASLGRQDMIAMLLDNGADIEERNCMGRTILMYAAWNGHKDIDGLLLDRKANVNARDNSQSVPLIDAAINGHSDVTALLLKRGADIEAKDSNGNTALVHALMHGQEGVVRLLLEKGADPESVNYDGYTPATLAEYNELHKMAGFLQNCAAEILEKKVLAAAGPLRRDIPAPKVIRIPRQG